MHGRDRGAAYVLTLLVGLALSTAALAALVPWLDGMIDHERARNAADAAALAGVTGGRAASARAAALNGGTLLAWRRDGPIVQVHVRVDERVATARATNGP